MIDPYESEEQRHQRMLEDIPELTGIDTSGAEFLGEGGDSFAYRVLGNERDICVKVFKPRSGVDLIHLKNYAYLQNHVPKIDSFKLTVETEHDQSEEWEIDFTFTPIESTGEIEEGYLYSIAPFVEGANIADGVFEPCPLIDDPATIDDGVALNVSSQIKQYANMDYIGVWELDYNYVPPRRNRRKEVPSIVDITFYLREYFNIPLLIFDRMNVIVHTNSQEKKAMVHITDIGSRIGKLPLPHDFIEQMKKQVLEASKS